jgi:hypothetical protein
MRLMYGLTHANEDEKDIRSPSFQFLFSRRDAKTVLTARASMTGCAGIADDVWRRICRDS